MRWEKGPSTLNKSSALTHPTPTGNEKQGTAPKDGSKPEVVGRCAALRYSQGRQVLHRPQRNPLQCLLLEVPTLVYFWQVHSCCRIRYSACCEMCCTTLHTDHFLQYSFPQYIEVRRIQTTFMDETHSRLCCHSLYCSTMRCCAGWCCTLDRSKLCCSTMGYSMIYLQCKCDSTIGYGKMYCSSIYQCYVPWENVL